MQDTHHLNLGRSPLFLATATLASHKKSAASVCMILVISWEARRRAGAIKATKATQATNLMVFPAVSDHSRLLVRLAFIGRPRWGLRVRELVVRSLRHLPMNSSRGGVRGKAQTPPNPRHRHWMPEELFPSVVRSHRAVMRWRQPRSIHLCDEHRRVQFVDAGGETTRGHVPKRSIGNV